MPKILITSRKASLYSEGIMEILKKHYPNGEITFTLKTSKEKLLKKLSFSKIDLLILINDLAYTCEHRLLEDIFSRTPNQSMLIVSDLQEEVLAKNFFELGVLGFINKNATIKEFIQSVEEATQGNRYLSENLKKQYLNNYLNNMPISSFNMLSSREKEVFFFLVEGQGILEISNSLGLVSSTVATYRKRLFEKLNVNNVVELYKKAVNWGLVVPN